MLSIKYIRIRKERPAEQNLSSIWRDACAELGIPCIIIYQDQKKAYISASLRHLQVIQPVDETAPEMQEKLQTIQTQFSVNPNGYWKHNDFYYTFDEIPVTDAKAAATLVFQSLIDAISLNKNALH